MKGSFKERLRDVLYDKRLSQVEFARIVNLSTPTVSRLLNSDGEPSFPTIQRICDTLNVNLIWLATGKGEMYNKTEETILIEAEEAGSEVAGLKQIHSSQSNEELILKIQSLEEENRRLRGNESPHNPKVVTVTVNHKQELVISLIDSKSMIHYPYKSTDIEFLKVLPAFTLPSSRFRNGSYRAFEIPGDGMSKRINRGDWTICQRVENLNAIRDSYVYVIVLEDEVLCRRVFNRIEERGRLRLKSDNPSFGDFEVEIDQVVEVWEVKSVMGFDLSNPAFELQNWIKRLEDDVFELKDQMKTVRKGMSNEA